MTGIEDSLRPEGRWEQGYPCASVLHDVIEDSPLTLDELRKEGFSRDVVEVVDRLTRRDGEDYGAFIRRAASDPVARKVKRADLINNLDAARLPVPTEADERRMTKYRRALEMVGE